MEIKCLKCTFLSARYMEKDAAGTSRLKNEHIEHIKSASDDVDLKSIGEIKKLGKIPCCSEGVWDSHTNGVCIDKKFLALNIKKCPYFLSSKDGRNLNFEYCRQYRDERKISRSKTIERLFAIFLAIFTAVFTVILTSP